MLVGNFFCIPEGRGKRFYLFHKSQLYLPTLQAHFSVKREMNNYHLHHSAIILYLGCVYV